MQTIDTATSVGTAPSAPGPHWVRLVFMDGGENEHELDFYLPDDRESYDAIVAGNTLISETPITAQEAHQSGILDARRASRRDFANTMTSQIQ